MSIEITVLGSNSALFAYNRHLTSQYISCGNIHFLVDCGEATQLQLAKYHLKPSKIDHIFISHLHGDHYFGLISLLSSMHLQGRKNKLTIYAPIGLKEILSVQFKYSETSLRFPLQLIELSSNEPQVIFENNKLTVSTIPLNHRVYTNGFLFKEKIGERRIDKEKLRREFTVQQILDLKAGKDIVNEEGNVLYKNEDYTLPPRKSYAYAFCSDTMFNPDIIPQIKGVDVLYHEATFGKADLERANKTKHSTAEQAAQMAKEAEVGKLLIGHFSARYESVHFLVEEARSIFPNTFAVEEGKLMELDGD